jgi:aminotransferase
VFVAEGILTELREGTKSHRFSQKVRAIPASGIRHFFELIANMDGVISLGVGEPDFVTPGSFVQAGIDAAKQGETHYTSNYGLLSLREAVSDHLDRLYGVRYNPKNEIIITVGVSEALLLALHALLDPGDEVLSSDPYYVAYLPTVVLAGGRFVPVRTTVEEDFRLHASQLEERISESTKAILLGYPSNPTGAQMTREDLQDIGNLAAERDLIVISDEIYDRLSYGIQHTCFPSLPGMRERTILLGGFSKAYAMTGWRVGWVCAPAEIAEAMMKIHQYIIMSAPTVSQYVALEAIRNGEEDSRRMIEEFDSRRRYVVEALRDIGLTTFEPKGAFYAFPSIRSTGMHEIEFAEALLKEESVAVIPGSAFGEGGAGHVRVCYTAPQPLLEEAMERIRRFVQRHS